MKLFPLQGPDCWQSWTKNDRKQYQEIGKHTSDLEKFNAERDSEKMKIRNKMEYYCKNLTVPVSTFLNVLLKYSDSIKHYFLTWLKILLDRYNRKVYYDLHKKNCPAQDIYSARIGLEHFFREMGQIYETVKGQEKECSKYPSIMAQLMVDGYCVELLDGDTTHVPVEWISAVFKELQTICSAAKFYTLSVIGVQSTGKSTLLNTMFGLNFNVSAGKCTHGVIMQLLSFHKDAKEGSKCDYLLLIDTEGLKSSTLSFIDNKYDNELATFVVGLADIAIINITGESIDNLKELLKMVSHGLIRINNIEISSSCKFVHNQITEPGAASIIALERKKFLQFLDKGVHQACELEYCVGKYKSFSELMKFDENQDILCLEPLWNGNPPMAKVNLEYAKHVQEFKMSLINHAGQHISHCSFVNFSIKISALWNAVLREQFLFSFKTTLEIIVRKEYYQKLSEWDTEFRLCYLDWESQARVSFRNNNSQDPKKVKEILLNEVEKVLRQTLNTIIEKKDEYFSESEYTEILKQWDTKTNEKIDEYFQEYRKQAKYHITQLLSEHIREIKVQEMICIFHKKINGLIDDLFSRTPDKWLSGEILKEKFDKEWSAWLENTPSIDHEYRSTKQIEHQILQILRKHIRMNMNLINQKLVKTPLTDWNTTFKINTKVHLLTLDHLIGESDILSVAEPRTYEWLQSFEFTYIESDYSFHSVLNQFDQHVSELINSVESKNKAYYLAFQFTKEFICDIVLTVSKQVEDFLISSEEKARKNDVKHELEKKKNDFFQILHALYNNKKKKETLKDSHTNMIECLCSIIGSAITKCLRNLLKYEINKDITISNPIFKSKENFKLSVLKVLLEKKCFDEYKLYFTNQKQSFKKWVHYFVDKHCSIEIDGHNCTKFHKLRDSKLQDLLESVQMAIIVTNTDSNNLTFSSWMTKFSANIRTMNNDVFIFISEHDFQIISRLTIPWKSLEDVEALKNQFSKCINPTLVKKDSLTMYNDMKDELNNYMWENLKKTVLGCTECCPFCKEMCDAQDECDRSEKHFIKLHRPKCLARVLHHPSRNIVVDICTTSVGSDCKFRNADTNWNWKPYKQYPSLYPNWFISNTIEQAEPYWKFVIARFRDDIAKWCGFGNTKSVPEEWDEICEDSVKDSLKLT